jgi:signal transduction histidine kinase
MRRALRTLHVYWAVVLVIAVLFGWWMIYFYRQSDFLAGRMAAEGVVLDAAEAEALRQAVAATTRMLLFEGAFLGLLLLGSMALVVRALQREVALARQQHNFLSAVTHELKSPIASARLYLESLELGRAEGDKRERYLRHAREDLDRLHAMVEQLLESARLSTSRPLLSPTELDLGEHVRSTLADLERRRVTQGARVVLSCPAPVVVRADAEAVATIVRNLVSNAVKYGGRPAEVQVEVGRDERGARLCVRDRGPGLGDLDGRRIFQPFVRGGDENVRTQQGVGLGLFLVGELVRASGGEVRARAAEPGLAVEVRLPAGAGAGQA